MPPTLGRLPALRRRSPCHPASCACQSACSDAGTPASCSQSLSLRSTVCPICGRPTVCHRPGPVRRPAGHTWRRFVDVHAASLFSAPFHYDAGVRAGPPPTALPPLVEVIGSMCFVLLRQELLPSSNNSIEKVDTIFHDLAEDILLKLSLY
ncbi:hypothetical protein SETIT_2G169000v2 [Setaria italica]|uniref:Uncharacterized protein n=1 Tax=Setaria italica TaxID=4555 RepID=A0A368PZQ9_SETIT|nr:hypothetical protein SETIT_2G169000v2 [Setaria italica]